MARILGPCCDDAAKTASRRALRLSTGFRSPRDRCRNGAHLRFRYASDKHVCHGSTPMIYGLLQWRCAQDVVQHLLEVTIGDQF
jgi:hypothetical protein